MRDRIDFRSKAPARLLLAVLGLVLIGCDKRTPVQVKPPPQGFDSATALIRGLEVAYRQRNYEKFTNLFTNPTVGQPVYLFLLSDPAPTGETSWGFTEEMRIERRMFIPQNPLPGETGVPYDLWLQSVDITLTPQGDFVDRPDLYLSSNNPNGLDPARWTATEATYGTYVFFQLAGSTDYQVNGRANFVVIEDKTKSNGDVGKWLIYRWEDLGTAIVARGGTDAGPDAVSQSNWGALKQLYR
jgi:hypothetical protein